MKIWVAAFVVLAWAAHTTSVSDVRLVGGGSPLQGRLEVNFGGTWGAVCATGFDNSDAVVVCRQLRLAGGVASGTFKRGTLPFSIAGVRCSGKETGLSGCRYTSTRACASGKAVGVICKKPPIVNAILQTFAETPADVRIGRLQVQPLGRLLGTVCDPAGTFGPREAQVACRTLGLVGGTVLRRGDLPPTDSPFYGPAPPITIGAVKCRGSEASLSGCSYDINPRCTHEEDVGLSCQVPDHLPVRLVGGGVPSKGRLEVRVGGRWGTVCATKPSGFTVTAAQAVCASLNMTGGRPRSGAAFGGSTLPILLSNMHCASSTTPLAACVYGGKARGCTHANDVGIVCKVPTFSLLNSFNGATEGLLEVALDLPPDANGNPRAGSICLDAFFTDREARVACTELGLSGGRVIPSLPGSGANAVVSRVACTGKELYLGNCTRQVYRKCRSGKAVAIRCKMPSITGLRIQGPPGIRSGILNVRLGSKWATVCDFSFGDDEADVACRELGFAGGKALYSALGSSIPFGIEKVECSGGEPRLEDCSVEVGRTCEPEYGGGESGSQLQAVGIACS